MIDETIELFFCLEDLKMSIDEEVKQAIAEFGDRAHERFRVFMSYSQEDAVDGVGTWYEFEDNDHMIFCPESIEKKPIRDLFAHDVAVYGDNAYLMWKITDDDNKMQPLSNNDIYVVFCLISDGIYKAVLSRKQSASLPFDLERAKRGDDLLFLKNGEWIDCTLESIGIKYFAVLGDNFESKGNVDDIPQLLRMKYPCPNKE